MIAMTNNTPSTKKDISTAMAVTPQRGGEAGQQRLRAKNQHEDGHDDREQAERDRGGGEVAAQAVPNAAGRPRSGPAGRQCCRSSQAGGMAGRSWSWNGGPDWRPS